MNARRVLYVAWAPFFSGAERALVRALRGLAGAVDPFVIVGTDGELASELRSMGVPHAVVELQAPDWRHPLASARSATAIMRAARRHRASLVHANDVPSFQPAGYIARALGIPAIAHVRFPDRPDGYRWFLRPAVARAIFVSGAQRIEAEEQAPDVFVGRSDVLHDCVEEQPEWSAAERASVRRELGLDDSSTIVAMAGQVAEVKGIWEFVDAATLMLSRRSNCHFVVLGDDLQTGGRVRREMEERTARAGLSRHFTFLGFRPDAARLVQAFDIMAVPSHVEPFGLAALEGIAAGRAVVASRVGGLPEIVVDGDSGMLVPPRSAAALAAAVAALAADPALRATLGAAGRRRARGVFGVASYATRLRQLYDRVCGAGAVSTANVRVEPA